MTSRVRVYNFKVSHATFVVEKKKKKKRRILRCRVYARGCWGFVSVCETAARITRLKTSVWRRQSFK